MAATVHAQEDPDYLPAYAVAGEEACHLPRTRRWPADVDREWAFGGATGAGATVCVVDSGIDAAHPLVGGVRSAVSVRVEGATLVEEDTAGDVCGHGTAGAGTSARSRSGRSCLRRGQPPPPTPPAAPPSPRPLDRNRSILTTA